jgi:hypothetical protein
MKGLLPSRYNPSNILQPRDSLLQCHHYCRLPKLEIQIIAPVLAYFVRLPVTSEEVERACRAAERCCVEPCAMLVKMRQSFGDLATRMTTVIYRCLILTRRLEPMVRLLRQYAIFCDGLAALR